MAFNPKCAVKYKKIPGDSKKSTENFFIAHKLINGFGDILNIVDFRQASIWLKEKANLKGYFPNLLIYDINNGSKVAYDIPAFKKLDGIQKQIEEEKKKYGDQKKLFQETGRNLSTLEPAEIENLQSTVSYQLVSKPSEELPTKGGQTYVYFNAEDAKRFTFLLEKHKEFPKEFQITKRITKYEKGKKTGEFIPYNKYVDLIYQKSNNNKKSNLYNIIDKESGEVIATKVRVLHFSQDVKSKIAEQYGLEFKPTKVFNANRSIGFALYRQKPSKAKYIAQAKRYLYDAIKFLNPEETALKINLDQIENLLEAYPDEMWDYINTTYSPEDSTNVNASINIQNNIKFKLPKLGLLQAIEKVTGKKLQGVTFKNYDRSGGIKKALGVEWGELVTIDYTKLSERQLRKVISYYLRSQNYFKPSSEEENVRKYAEHRGIDYEKLRELVFGDFDKALENISYNYTSNSDTIELSKWRESIRNYDWQMAELMSKPYEDYRKTAKERIINKFKDKNLSNGISHLDYFFVGNFNWLNINFNNISGQYYEADMETQADVGFDKKVMGFLNPFEVKTYKKPTAGKNFLQEEEVFNRLAAILHEPFHALHALSYGTSEELELRKAFNKLRNTEFGAKMMEQVFGSGYNQKQINEDILYKEFTAFATQLMLYPKEWIKKTDLRSNDIYEFIEKVQTLQDKTYTEIVKTQQKIGEIEKEVTEEEKIKLTFLEKLYNYIVKALNKIIPLSKKFFNTISDTKLVSKKVTEDVFGTVEEEVTKVQELPKDIKKSKDEFLEAMDELKSAINTLMQVDSKLFSSDNINKFFTGESYTQEAGKVIEVKPGVEELFESNPELANIGTQQQYSAYLNTIFPDSKVKGIVYRGSENGIEKEENPWLYFSDSQGDAYMYSKANVFKSGKITERNPIRVIRENIAKKYNLSKNVLWAVTDTQLGIDGLEYEKYITKEEANEARNLIKTNQDIKDLKRLTYLYDTVKIESEGDLMKQFDDSDYLKYKPEYDNLRKRLDKYFNREEVGKLEAVTLNITNPYDGGNQEDLINNREAYKDGHDGATLLGGEHFIIKNKPEQFHILGGKQDIEGFKEFVGKEEVELSPEEMYQKSLDLSDKEIEERINKCRS